MVSVNFWDVTLHTELISSEVLLGWWRQRDRVDAFSSALCLFVGSSLCQLQFGTEVNGRDKEKATREMLFPFQVDF